MRRSVPSRVIILHLRISPSIEEQFLPDLRLKNGIQPNLAVESFLDCSEYKNKRKEMLLKII
jgi:hypothetical protein